MSYPNRIPHGKPVRLETRSQAAPGPRNSHEASPITTTTAPDDSDRTRHHLHRFFEALLRRSDH